MKKTKILQDKKMLLMAAVIGVLLIVTGFQTYEIMSISSALGGVSEQIQSNQYATPSTSSSGSGSEALQNNLNNLQTMVGGC